MSVSACKHKFVCRLQGSLVIYTRHYPEQLHCAYVTVNEKRDHSAQNVHSSYNIGTEVNFIELQASIPKGSMIP